MRLALALAAAALAAPAAQAQVAAFEEFESLCVKPRADARAALTAADAAGWMPVPDTLMRQLSRSEEFRDVEARLKTTKDQMRLALVGSMDAPVGGKVTTLRMCAVATLPPDAAFATRAESSAGVPPDPKLSNQRQKGYIFVEEGGVRRAIESPNDATTANLLESGRLNVVAVQSNRDMTLAIFAVPTSATSTR